MRLIVFFDLPTYTKIDKNNYTKFRKYLLNEGFMMMQYSIYTRICNGSDSVQKYMKRIKSNTPPKGHVRALYVTEKQWEDMEIIIGSKSFQEEKINSDNLTIF